MSLRGRSQQTRMTPRSLAVKGDTPLTPSKTACKLAHDEVKSFTKNVTLAWCFGPVCF